MKKKIKNTLKMLLFMLLCTASFVFIGYTYLNNQTAIANDGNITSEYYKSVPDEVTIMVNINNTKTLVNLNFYNKETKIIIADGLNITENTLYGYKIDYTLTGDYELLSGLCDIAGGIELEIEGENLNFTGNQLTEILTTTLERSNLRREITLKLFDGFSVNGFLKNDFLFVIENSNTDLTLPDCLLWGDFFAETSSNTRIIN